MLRLNFVRFLYSKIATGKTVLKLQSGIITKRESLDRRHARSTKRFNGMKRIGSAFKEIFFYKIAKSFFTY